MHNVAASKRTYEQGMQYYLAGKYNKAFACFKTASDDNYLAADLWLFVMYDHGTSQYNPCVDKRLKFFNNGKWFQDELTTQNNALATFNLGYCYKLNYRELVAKEYFENAAKQGFIPAVHELGNDLYRSGADHVMECVDDCHCTKNAEYYYQQAVPYYQQVADQDYAPAQFQLASCLQKGHGVTQNNQKAVSYYQKAADQGCAAAQCELGTCYLNGDGVIQDNQAAVNYLQKAANQNHAEAQWKLGAYYANSDYLKSARYYVLAAMQEYLPGSLAMMSKLDKKKSWYCEFPQKLDSV